MELTAARGKLSNKLFQSVQHGRSERIIHSTSISPILHNPCLLKSFQVKGGQRLFGFQEVRQITHTLFPLAERVKNLDAGRIAKRAEPGGGLLRGNRTRRKNEFYEGRCHTGNISIKIDMSREALALHDIYLLRLGR
jgi:hypothetical protein